MSRFASVLLLTSVCLTPSALAADSPAPKAAAPEGGPVHGTLDGQVLAGGSGCLVILDTEGRVVWRRDGTGLVHDAWMLPDGHVLYADGKGVTEITPDQKVVFQYAPTEQKGGGAYACQRLPNGNTLVGENSAGRVVEVDPKGTVVFAMPVQPSKPGQHHNMRMVRKLANGNYLVCHSGAHQVREYTPAGKVVWEVKVTNVAFAAVRTDKGTTIVSAIDTITEFDAAGKALWAFRNTDVPGVKITNMTGIHLLPDGHLVVGCYRAYADGQGCGLFEITRDREVVWRYSNPKGPKTGPLASPGGTLMAVQKLDKAGKALPGPALR